MLSQLRIKWDETRRRSIDEYPDCVCIARHARTGRCRVISILLICQVQAPRARTVRRMCIRIWGANRFSGAEQKASVRGERGRKKRFTAAAAYIKDPKKERRRRLSRRRNYSRAPERWNTLRCSVSYMCARRALLCAGALACDCTLLPADDTTLPYYFASLISDRIMWTHARTHRVRPSACYFRLFTRTASLHHYLCTVFTILFIYIFRSIWGHARMSRVTHT